MDFKRKVIKIGNSLGVSFKKSFRKNNDIEVGDFLTLELLEVEKNVNEK